MDKGIVLISFGKRGYKHMAYNLAFSIRKFSQVPIALICDNTYSLTPSELSVFNKIITLNAEDYLVNGKIDPAKAKISLYPYLPFKHNLYLDIDAVAIKDVEPILDHCISQNKFYCTDVVDKGTKTEKIDYTWAENKLVWEFFNLPEDATLQTIQSSFAYIKKCRQSESFFNQVKKNYEKKFPLDKLKWAWGGTMPDELLFSVTAAQKGIDVNANIKPIFFGNKYGMKEKEIKEKYSLVSLYGNGGGGRTLVKLYYIEWIEKELINMFKSEGMNNKYKVRDVMRDKHANNGHKAK